MKLVIAGLLSATIVSALVAFVHAYVGAGAQKTAACWQLCAVFGVLTLFSTMFREVG